MMTVQTETKPNRTVTDGKGHAFELTGKVGAGGQGVVCTTSIPGVLAKVARPGMPEERRASWMARIRELMRRPLEGLQVAAPLTLALHPRTGYPVGYLMEVMDGLVPLTSLIETAREENVEGYLRTGGLRKRLRILASLGRTLADLHGRGLAYGDLSPANVFVSRSPEHAEVWLIDADNIDCVSHDGSQRIYTPDYGAPEILRGEAGISTLTDSWSFGVIAFRLLTLEHPLKGNMVLDGEPEMEERALKGEFPWIDHPDDLANALVPDELRRVVLEPTVLRLFGRCFGGGMADPGLRLSMAEWAGAFEAALLKLADCGECGSAFHFAGGPKCPFCGHIQPCGSVVTLRGYLYVPPGMLPEGMTDEERQRECWTRTQDVVVVSGQPVKLWEFPPDLNPHCRNVCTVRLSEGGLMVEPGPYAEVSLQAGARAVAISRPQRLAPAPGTAQYLHLGPTDRPHTAWRISWQAGER